MRVFARGVGSAVGPVDAGSPSHVAVIRRRGSILSVGAQPGRHRETVLQRFDRHDPVVVRPLRQEPREEADRAEPEDRHAVAELDPRVAPGQRHHQWVETAAASGAPPQITVRERIGGRIRRRFAPPGSGNGRRRDPRRRSALLPGRSRRPCRPPSPRAESGKPCSLTSGGRGILAPQAKSSARNATGQYGSRPSWCRPWARRTRAHPAAALAPIVDFADSAEAYRAIDSGRRSRSSWGSGFRGCSRCAASGVPVAALPQGVASLAAQGVKEERSSHQHSVLLHPLRRCRPP